MRFDTPLDDAFASRGHVRILRALDDLTDGLPASAREVARRADLAHNRASKILADLARQGIAKVQRVARSDLYELNRDHALFPLLDALFGDERKVQGELERFLRRRLLARIGGVEEAYLFGSIARRQSRVGSDIDLAIVLPRTLTKAADEALTGIADEVRRRFGAELSVHLSNESLAKRVKMPSGRSLWKRIEAEGIQLLPAKGATHA